MTLNAKPIFLWDNLLARPDAQLSATSSDPDHPVQYLADWREYLTWRAGSGAPQNIEVSFPEPKPARAMCIYNHNLSSVENVTLSGSNNGSDWDEILSVNPTSDDPILKLFNQVSYRYYRLAMGMSMVCEIGLLFLGDYLEFPGWTAAGIDPNQEDLILEKGKSEEGYLLGSVEKYRKRRIVLDFRYLSDSWVRNSFIPFWKSHLPRPFLFAWDHQNHSEETYLVEVARPELNLPYQPVYRSLRLELEGRV